LIRRFLTRILMVILIAFCGYNWLQVKTLQGQVRELQAQQAIRERRPEATDGQRDWRKDLTTLQTEMKHLQQQSAAFWHRAGARAGRSTR